MKRYEEALKLSEITIEKYDRFYSEIHFARYEQLVIRLKCLVKMKMTDEANILYGYIADLAKRIFASNAKQLVDLELVMSSL